MNLVQVVLLIAHLCGVECSIHYDGLYDIYIRHQKTSICYHVSLSEDSFRRLKKLEPCKAN